MPVRHTCQVPATSYSASTAGLAPAPRVQQQRCPARQPVTEPDPQTGPDSLETHATPADRFCLFSWSQPHGRSRRAPPARSCTQLVQSAISAVCGPLLHTRRRQLNVTVLQLAQPQHTLCCLSRIQCRHALDERAAASSLQYMQAWHSKQRRTCELHNPATAAPVPSVRDIMSRALQQCSQARRPRKHMRSGTHAQTQALYPLRAQQAACPFPCCAAGLGSGGCAPAGPSPPACAGAQEPALASCAALRSRRGRRWGAAPSQTLPSPQGSVHRADLLRGLAQQAQAVRELLAALERGLVLGQHALELAVLALRDVRVQLVQQPLLGLQHLRG